MDVSPRKLQVPSSVLRMYLAMLEPHSSSSVVVFMLVETHWQAAGQSISTDPLLGEMWRSAV